MTGSAAELDDARVRREVVSFVRRSNRMRSNQRRAWETYRDRFVLEVPRWQTSTSIHPDASLDLVAAFGRDAELIVEIGPGAGESLIPMAEVRPEANVLAFEVYRPAIARMLGSLVRAGVENVRIIEADAVAGLERLLPARSIDELWMFFPDPWPKPRHHKRRLVTPAFADLAASRLKPGGMWRAGDGLCRLCGSDTRHPRGRSALCQRASERRSAALGGPTGQPVRAAGAGCGPRDRRSWLSPCRLKRPERR